MRRKLRQGLLLLAATLVVGALGTTTAKAGVIEEHLKPISFWEHSVTASAMDGIADWEPVEESSLAAGQIPLGSLAEAYGSDVPNPSPNVENQEALVAEPDSDINWMSLALNVEEVKYSSETTSLRHGPVAVSAAVVAPEPVPVPAAAGLGILGMAVVAGFRRRSSANAA